MKTLLTALALASFSLGLAACGDDAGADHDHDHGDHEHKEGDGHDHDHEDGEHDEDMHAGEHHDLGSLTVGSATFTLTQIGEVTQGKKEQVLELQAAGDTRPEGDFFVYLGDKMGKELGARASFHFDAKNGSAHVHLELPKELPAEAQICFVKDGATPVMVAAKTK